MAYTATLLALLLQEAVLLHDSPFLPLTTLPTKILALMGSMLSWLCMQGIQSAVEQGAEAAKSTFKPLQDAFDFEDVPGVDANDPLRMAFRSMDTLGETGDSFKRYLSNIIPGVQAHAPLLAFPKRTPYQLLHAHIRAVLHGRCATRGYRVMGDARPLPDVCVVDLHTHGQARLHGCMHTAMCADVQLKRSLSTSTGGASDAVNAYIKQLQEAASSATSSSQGSANEVANQVRCAAGMLALGFGASPACLTPQRFACSLDFAVVADRDWRHVYHGLSIVRRTSETSAHM